MHNWFQCKIKYERNAEDGAVVKVNESYLVDALSFTEAEERINEEMKPFISGEFLVSDIKRAKIAELFPDENGDKWYRCKVNFVTLDEEKGVEKRTASTMFSQASTLKDALEVLEKGMKGTMADYEIASIVETNIMDVFVYKAE
ncbi:MAG: DUF4494 domain-containing protein [Paludibacteraceae bacterium]